MPQRTDIHKVLIIVLGSIIIGQGVHVSVTENSA